MKSICNFITRKYDKKIVIKKICLNEKKYFDIYTIKESSSIENSLFKLDKSKDKCLVVTNSKQRLLGTLTDGDVRRALINGIDFSHSIKNIYNKRPFYIKKENNKNIIKGVPRNIFENYKIIPIVIKNISRYFFKKFK